jgi:predicted heme/steroid binding protein
VSAPVVIPDENLKHFTQEELAQYDGSNEELPVYLSIQGKVTNFILE